MARRKMIAKVRYNYRKEDAGRNATIELDVDLSRFEKQYEDAQFVLDSMVMTDMKPYMPHQTGTFINVTSAQSASLAGSGTVIAGASPMGRFLYEGKKMVDQKTGRGPFNVAEPGETPVWRYQKGAKLKATDQPLNYDTSHNPKVTDHWFDEAKKNHGKSWVKAVKKEAGGG